MINVKTDQNQAKQKSIVGIIKINNQESTKTLGLQPIVCVLV